METRRRKPERATSAAAQGVPSAARPPTTKRPGLLSRASWLTGKLAFLTFGLVIAVYLLGLAPVVFGPVLRHMTALYGRSVLPQVSGTLNVTGLHAPVEILRDEFGIPHIYAKDAHDVYFAQGFVHAQDRLWQVETNRRVVTGRMSEFVGPAVLDVDRFVRTFGFARLGRQDLATIPESVRETVRAYVAGLNAWLSHERFRKPLEFSLAGIEPEPFTEEEVLALGRFMAWQLSNGWDSELVRHQLMEKLGPELAAELDIVQIAENPVHLPEGIELNELLDGGVLRAVGKSPYLQKGLGSNAWVVSGSRTKSGRALLANDPHLHLTTPSIWYHLHLNSEDGVAVTGVSVPGLPSILIGHNADIAWGVTLAFVDMEDLVVEKFEGETTQYYDCGELVQAEVIHEEIIVKGSEPHVEEVVITRHGPIISGTVETHGMRIAFQSAVLRHRTPMTGFLSLNRAKNWDDFVDSIALIDGVSLNIVYSDVKGNIGYYTSGSPPVRKAGQGTHPVPGWECTHDWVGSVPFTEMPHALNPKKGYIISTNQPIVPTDWEGPFLSTVYVNGYRAKRIDQILSTDTQHTPEATAALQLDVMCLPGKEFAQEIVKRAQVKEGTDAALALKLLREWDGQLTPETVGGTIYEVARYQLLRVILEPLLGVKLTEVFMGNGTHPLFKRSNEFYGHDTTALLRLLRSPNSAVIAKVGGDKNALINQALTQTVKYLRDTIGSNPAQWKWGWLHRLTFPHPLSAVPPMDVIFNVGGGAIGGDMDTVMLTGFTADAPYRVNTWAPSLRHIIEMSDPDSAQGVYAPGQSGQLGSRHYEDLLPLFLEGKYFNMHWTRGAVEAAAVNRLLLQ